MNVNTPMVSRTVAYDDFTGGHLDEDRWGTLDLFIPRITSKYRHGLPSWNLEGLIVGIAARPSAYKDVAGLGQWLPEAVADVDADAVVSLLTEMPRTTAQRAAYLLGAAGNDVARAAIVGTYPATETAWLGPRVAGQGFFDAKTQVNDTRVHQYLSVGTGS